MVLVGMQPVFTHVPPNRWRSMMATFMPAAARPRARLGPAWPVPMMMASKCRVMAAFAPPERLCPEYAAIEADEHPDAECFSANSAMECRDTPTGSSEPARPPPPLAVEEPPAA